VYPGVLTNCLKPIKQTSKFWRDHQQLLSENFTNSSLRFQEASCALTWFLAPHTGRHLEILKKTFCIFFYRVMLSSGCVKGSALLSFYGVVVGFVTIRFKELKLFTITLKGNPIFHAYKLQIFHWYSKSNIQTFMRTGKSRNSSAVCRRHNFFLISFGFSMLSSWRQLTHDFTNLRWLR